MGSTTPAGSTESTGSIESAGSTESTEPNQSTEPTESSAADDAPSPPAGSGPTRAQKIWRRTWVGGSLALATAGLLALSARAGMAWLVPAIGLALALLALREVARMGAAGAALAPLQTLWAVPLLLLATWAFGDPVFAASGASDWERLAPLTTRLAVLVGGGFALGLLLGRQARRAGRPEPHPLGPMMLLAWVLFPLLGLGWVRAHYGASGLIALIVLSKVGDIAGYYVGSAIGKTHPFPRLSPGKTVAGCVGSFVAGAAAGVACQAGGLLPDARLGLLSGLLFGAVLNLASQAGDLLESWLKRRGGVKDSGTTFGPSGGVLDVVDSLLLSVPAAIALLPALFVL